MPKDEEERSEPHLYVTLIWTQMILISKIKLSEREEGEDEGKRGIHKISTSTSGSSSKILGTPVQTPSPSYSPRERESDRHNAELVQTPSSSPTPLQEERRSQSVLTPQISQEAEDNENEESVVTPPFSPKPEPLQTINEFPKTPPVTPGASPVKVKPHPTPEKTPTGSPQQLRQTTAQIDTPAFSSSPRRRGEASVDAPKSPSPILSPKHPHTRPASLPVVSVTSTSSSEISCISQVGVQDPTFHDQGTQADIYDRIGNIRNDDLNRSGLAVSQGVSSPETPSVVCHSSADLTISSVEATDITGQTISEGELLSGAAQVTSSVEDGEVPAMSFRREHNICKCCTLYRCKWLRYHDHKVAREECFQRQDSFAMKSEGEVDFEESSEAILVSDKESTTDGGENTQLDNGTSQQGHFRRDEEYQEILTDPADSVQVSVVQDESYSSGDATNLTDSQLEALRRENARLLSRLGSFGSFSFLSHRTSSSGSSRSSSSK